MENEFLISRTDDAQDLPLPARATPLSAGLDLRSTIAIKIRPGKREMVPVGIKIALPAGYEAQIRPRSGLALRHGIGIVNSPATVDADFRGELKVILINWGEEPFVINRGDRIAQMVICPVAMVEFIETDDLPDSIRGAGGLGHSGVE